MNEQELLNFALKENWDAIKLVNDVAMASQLFDDLYDGDKPVDKTGINSLIWLSFIEIQENRFFVANRHELQPFIKQSILDWQDANRLEEGTQHDRTISFVLRSSVSKIVLHCAYLIGGKQWRDYVADDVYPLIYSDVLEDYLAEHD